MKSLYLRLCKQAATLLLCLTATLGQLSLYAQNVPITGKVVSESGAPVIGVSIQVVGTSKGTSTDVDGKFKLDAPAGATLKLTFIGYLPKEVKADASKPMIIALVEDIQKLNDVVVVGYGTQKKVSVTGAISTVDMKDKAGQPITNVSNALHGVPGLSVNLSNSQPGVDRSTIRIRGIGTTSASGASPMVLVDGIEYSMDELNPNDIESVTVLKDAAAAIYGSKGANGVIMVTTKKGKGQARVDYGFNYGRQRATYLPDIIDDPIAYMNLKNQALLNEGKAVEYSAADIEEYKNGMSKDPFTYPANNWYKIALKDGVLKKHDLSVSGSGEKYQYRLSLGYLDRDGILFGPGNHEKKYSLGVNVSADITKRLKVGATLDGYYRNYTQPFYTDTWTYLARALPILSDTLQDGRYGNSWLRTAGRNNWENPRMLAFNGLQTKVVQRFLSTVFLEYKLPFDLKYSAKFGVDKYDGLLSGFTPRMQTFNPKTGAPINWNSPATAPRAAKTDYNDLNITFFNTLDWARSFGKHNLSAMIGASYYNASPESWATSFYGYLDGSLDAFDAGNTWNSTSGNLTRDVLESYFGRVNYDYDGRYLFQATLRSDGSSRLSPATRWMSFPSAELGWRIDKESFFRSNFISLLKLRGSYGSMGNQSVPLYSYMRTVRLGEDYSFGGTQVPGAAMLADADPRLRWERTTSANIGADINLLKSRVALSLDVYNRKTTGMLRPKALPSQVGGLSGTQKNVGSMLNRGVEFTAQYSDQFGDVGLNVYGNVSYNYNEITSLDGEIVYNSDGTILKEGSPINSFYILQAEGLFQTADEVKNWAYQGPKTKPGYIKYKDQNGDGIINGDDRVLVNISSQTPKWNYAFGFTVNYKGISLNTAFQGVGGIKALPVANLIFPFNNGANATKNWLTDAWTPENPDAKLPIVTTSTGNVDNFQRSTFWLRDVSYLRMRNIQLAYALPQRWLDKAKIKKVSVFINGENLLTFSPFKEFDPESIMDQTDLYTYPMLKTFNGGINVTF
ncbi:TonB-linked SusC/RagA family outer membrane protein [Chitinophaga terrae (ex Kim and Jung 2007)]|uniref:SusC/RagA family TonB-linked outer membrane protein n=1 Tax=Chitinophaga terrae (ex Kim and Jung 2007) TaxID=408074 RepID=UPI002784038C|nr:TonB-dependent receptor [Chitinophaga terrae (ex Kim and Jung 2007)]MDQ0108716.1 TonB-linked SusC/RagA family outer membrane protein [Chitinophaga terrae (ex Kim and Jung 2007)]